MSAIKVTADLKAKNELFEKMPVDTIYVGSIPNRFFGAENISGGYQGRTDLHNSDGWKEEVQPVLTETQKRGEIYFDAPNNVFTYYKVNKSTAELEQEKEQKYQAEKEKIKQEKINKIAEDAINASPLENPTYFKDWVAITGGYPILENGQPVIRRFNLKLYKNTIVGNTNDPNKGGWTEIK